ncbi:NAD-dependent epimerase/dehydratase family protein [Labedella endophytica]|nr:NAD-dependent epimerase/dehydratase family protein [Labedella endophytica]
MKAVILGGTGAIGAATALRLLGAGWSVDVTGRDPSAMPPELVNVGGRFHPIDRSDASAVGGLAADDTDLLVDLLAFSGPDVRALLPVMGAVGRTVLMSGRAVYTDPFGRHINSDEAPVFPVPIPEDNPTLDPAADDIDPFTREGYAPGKVAVEREALASGLEVTIIRPSKVHGPFARNARTRSVVERMTSGAAVIDIADGGRSIDHLTAAANAAALVETAAAGGLPGVVNGADPDPLTALEIFETIADVAGWTGELRPIVDDGDEERGHHPWRSRNPIVLDMTRAIAAGYEPAGTGRALLADEVEWVLRSQGGR